jgi:hypothetical protein
MLRGDTGTFDSPNAGIHAVFAFTPGGARVELAATYWLTQKVTLPPAPPNPQRGGRLDLASVGVLGCYAVLRAEGLHIDVAPCAGAEVGLFEGTSFGVSELGNGAATWSALRAGALGTWRFLGPLALRLDLEAALPLSRPTFIIGGVADNVHRPAALSGRAGAGLELHF